MSLRLRHGLLLLLAVGCNAYDGSLIDGQTEEDVIRPPSNPNLPDSPGTQILTFALDTIDFDQGGDALEFPDAEPAVSPAQWQTTGYDLDGYDTRLGERDGWCTPRPYDPDDSGPLPSSSRFPIDGERGRDNVMGRSILPLLFQTGTLPTIECDLNEAFRRGEGTMLIQVTGWNGACDPRVRAEVHVATDGTSAQKGSGMGEVDGTNPANWLGPNLRIGGMDAPPPNPGRTDGFFDTFYADPSGYIDNVPTNPAEIVDDNAFIVCGSDMVPTLVVHLDSVAFNIYIGNRGVIAFLNDAVMVMKLSADFSRIVDGVVAGRFPIGRLGDVGRYVGVCGSFRDVINERFRVLGDVLEHEHQDRAGSRDRECNAVSLALPFTGRRAFFGGVAPSPGRPLPNACDPDGDGNEEDGNAIPGTVAGYACCDVSTCMATCCCDAGCATRPGCTPCNP